MIRLRLLSQRITAGILMIACFVCFFTTSAFAAYDPGERETVKVGFFAMDGYHMIDEEGNKSGYGYDFLRLLARYWDVDYEYVGYGRSWQEMLDMLEDGEIDMLTSARWTAEREEKFDFSRPIGSNECMLTVRNDNTSVILYDYSTYDGLEIGFLKGNARNDDFEHFAEERGFTYSAVYFDQISDMEDALQSGEVDALVSSSMRAVSNERVVETFESENVYVLVKKGNTKLLDEVNYAIEQVNDAEGDWATGLYNRYYTTDEIRKLDFTDKEKEIIAEYSSKDKPLRALCDPERRPYSFVEDGEMKGILPDYFRKLAEYTGISYEFVICDSGEAYAEVKQDETLYDLLIDNPVGDEKSVEEKHLGVTAPYMQFMSAKLTRRDFTGEIRKVATIAQSASVGIEDYYVPDAEKIIYPSRQEAMQAVKDGEADAAFVYYYMAQEFVHDDSSGITMCTLLNQPSFRCNIVVTQDIDRELAGILTKAIYSMPDKTIEDIASGYTSYQAADITLRTLVQLHPDIAMVIISIVVLTVIVLAVLSVNIHSKNNKLKAAVIKERADQEKIKQALDSANLRYEIIAAISKSYCSICRIDIKEDHFEEIYNDEAQMHRLTGKEGCASEALNCVCDTLVAPEYRELVRRFMDVSTLAERLKNEEYIYTEYRMNDGNWHCLRFIVKKRDDFGNVTNVLCTIRSISDAKKREENLYFEAEAAKREAEVKTRFLATMSHDIRTPLNGVIGMIKLADQCADDKDTQQKARDKALEALNYLVSLVNDVLDINKLQSGELKLRDMSFNIVEELCELNKKYDRKANEKGIRYVVDWKKADVKHPIVMGNPIYLGRILSNITDNAIKFSPTDSTISVWVEESEPKDGIVEFTFSCEDHGIGMSKEFLKHAFDMFSQENVSSRSEYEGTGLGLAIADKLAERMGGSIELQSEQGAGTTAIIKLPFKISDQQDVEMFKGKAENIVNNVSVEGVRALVVDDNELNREIAKCMLENHGIEVTCAVDGQDAVEVFERSEPGYFGVIYMDIMMPRLNGVDAARTIRNLKRPDAWSIPIIVLSANAFAEDIIKSKMAGINIHLSKPLDDRKMIAALKYCIADQDFGIREEL